MNAPLKLNNDYGQFADFEPTITRIGNGLVEMMKLRIVIDSGGIEPEVALLMVLDSVIHHSESLLALGVRARTTNLAINDSITQSLNEVSDDGDNTSALQATG